MTARGGLTQIGKYPVVRKLGEGATSEVYLCADSFNLREVAIKVAFPESFEDPSRGRVYRKLFLTEAKLAGKLQHPHICQIYDAVADESLNYIVMEYVDGGTLEKYCGPDALLPVERIVEIVFKCTRALEFAHKLGVTHRDIKPANILHTGETEVKISDFGAALIASQHETTQVAGVGSPAYMSPEQLKDQPLDHRTDIYSVGVVMYHLLTGRLPFQAANNFTLIYQITSLEPDPPSALRPGIPAAVDAIVRRAMAKDVGRRYATWSDFSADLASAFRSEHFGSRKSQEFADSDRFETLRRLPFFENFSDAELWEVARISTWRHAPAGEVLMKEGEPGDNFCILAQGEVNITKRGRLLNTLRAGEPFGEMAYLSRKEHARGADVTVAADANIISVPTHKLNQASEACRHKFDRAFMEILVERLAAANVRLSGV
ncbi:MAG: serine/threonine protein kinase [Burkholderiales bacterium]|jgi:serine/threonine protein kinase|nr:serine/threonine protein kinase [Burkholderiales bacterium]